MYNRLILFLLLIGSLPSYSQRLLKDIASSDASSSINADLFSTDNYIIKGDTLFFLAQDTTMTNYFYRNIWYTNGTTANTKKVTNRNLHNQSNSYKILCSFKGKVYYRDVTNTNLYATDGNDTTIVKTFANRIVLKAVAIDGWLYLFVESYQEDILELWKTDGTSINTNEITDIFTNFHGFNYDIFFTSGNKIYFNVTTNTPLGAEPWVTDGTASGTKLLKDIVVGSASSAASGFKTVGNTVFFSALDSNSRWKLWKTDGTEAGTLMVANEIDGNANYYPRNMISYADYLYFTANTDKLYKTDGNTITLVKTDLETYWNIVKVNNLMYFVRRNGNEIELWKSNGTNVGTEKIKTILTSQDYNNTSIKIRPGTSKVYIQFSYFRNSSFQNITQHLVSDGTTAGTININTLNPNFSTGSYTNQMAVVGDTYYFTAYDAVNGFELWKSDGTSGGTFMVKNINKGIVSSEPEQFVVLNNDVYFSADDIKYGREIWKSDGTAQNTNLVMDYNAGINPDVNYYSIISGMIAYNDMIIAHIGYQLVKFSSTMPPVAFYSQGLIGHKDPEFIKFDNRVFYKGYDTINGGYDLFATDGNTAYRVKDLSTNLEEEGPTNFIVSGGLLYFSTKKNTQIWKSDGTEAGTVLVKTLTGGIINSKFYAVNGLLMFIHRTALPFYNYDLWKTDGTEAGTVLVKDINPYPGGDGIRNLVVYNNTLFFDGYDGSTSHLYKTDGTSANTQLFSDKASISVPIVFKNKLFFVAYESVAYPDYTYALYATDGISAPVKIKQLPDNWLQRPENKILVNIDDNFLVFDVVPNFSRHELWVSDGTTAGTKLARVIRQKEIDNDDVNIKEYLYHNHKLYFAADDGIHGKELWVWDFLACLESMTIANPISQDTDVIVDKFIAGSNKINANSKVNYYANKYIVLNPGFETQSGVRFTANMDGCINLATSSNSTTNTGEPIFKNFSTKGDAKPSITQFLNDPLNAELKSLYISEKNNHNELNIAWIIDELPDKYSLKMRVNGKELIGYLTK